MHEMELVRQKVYSLEQAQMELKNKYVCLLLRFNMKSLNELVHLNTFWLTINADMKAKLRVCIESWRLGEVRLRQVIPVLHRMPLRRSHRRRPSVTVRTMCLAPSWPARPVKADRPWPHRRSRRSNSNSSSRLRRRIRCHSRRQRCSRRVLPRPLPRHISPINSRPRPTVCGLFGSCQKYHPYEIKARWSFKGS